MFMKTLSSPDSVSTYFSKVISHTAAGTVRPVCQFIVDKKAKNVFIDLLRMHAEGIAVSGKLLEEHARRSVKACRLP